VTWFFLAIGVVVFSVLLEGKRQAKKYGRASRGPNLAGGGLLELQQHL
jgi:hypothetical protein